MPIVVDQFVWEDRTQVRAMLQHMPENVARFDWYVSEYFSSTGERLPVRTGFPDSALVAKENNSAVGYIQWFTDCYDGYADTIEICAADSPFPSARASEIQERMRDAMQDWS